jgi:putative phage-type endonuclease
MTVDIELRRSAIGGSDIAAILGYSQYKTALNVYLEKRGLVDPMADNARLEMGRYLEEPILKWYLDTQECRASNREKFVRHPENTFLAGNLDLSVINEHEDEWILDAKNLHWRSAAQWGDEQTDEIPMDALFQGHHYLYLCPWAQRVDFVVLKGGNWPPRIFPVLRDAELYEVILPRLRAFWFDHVVPGIPPYFDFSDLKTLEAIKALYPPKAEKVLPVEIQPVVSIAGREVKVSELAEAFDLLKSMGKEIESRQKRVEAALRAAQGDSRAGVVDDIVIERIYNKGGFRPAHEVAPYDYLKVKFPKNYERKITAARVVALIEGEVSNG